MDYNRIMQEILNIGEELLKSGAEIFRVEDSLYRMCRSYGFCEVMSMLRRSIFK